jgi:hypothetical protein
MDDGTFLNVVHICTDSTTRVWMYVLIKLYTVII